MKNTAISSNNFKDILLDLLACLLAVGIVSVSTIFHYGFYKPERLAEPTNYSWDGFYCLALVKAVETGDVPIASSKEIQNLGAPYGGDWNPWPAGRDLMWRVGGGLAKIFGVGMASNLMLILAHATAALGMYFSLRWIACDRVWALVFSICFGLAPYLFWRSWGHIPLTFVYAVPVFCAAAYHLFRDGNNFLESPKNLLILAIISTVLGGGIYYQAVYFGMLTIAALYILINQKTFKPFFIILFFAFLLAGFFILQSWPVYYDTLKSGKNFEAVVRYYGGVQTGALKPVELFLPGATSGIPLLSQISQFYQNQDVFTKSNMDCEFLAAYLGLPGIICLLLLLAATAFLLLTRQEAKISGWFWLILSIFSFSVIGGLNGIIGLGKFYLLRGSNRFSIFILAAGFFFLATLFTRNRNRLGKVASYGIALLFIGLAIGESALRMSPARNSGPEAISLEKDRSYFLKLEAELPKGAMLFNYPPDRFPAGPLNYPELRGYIASENLRFSYGSIAGRAREAWQSEVAALPAKEMVERLQALGFSGILVYINGDLNREGNAGLKDATFQKLGELRELGLAEINDRTGSFVFLKITPASNPAYPEAPVYFTKGFWSEAIQKPNVIQPSPLRWAAQSDCIIEIFNEQKQPRFAILLGNLIGTQASQLDILYKNESLWKSEIQKSEKTDFQTKPILVPPQTHARFRIKCNTPPLFTDGRKFSFGISKVVIKWENKEQPPITSSPNIPNIFCFRNVPYEENSF